ncbi:formimidoylglutamate deiminase [Marivivens marinus]|uniref:formimidoylglutamate deiminase n=1 Tax=Marivivens marinus TaxID=3110173 RepID=UPI003B849395
MQRIWAEQVLTAAGWRKNCAITIGDDGRIAEIAADTTPTSGGYGCLIAAPVNAHSHAFQRAMAGLSEGRGPNPQDSFWTWRKLMYRFLDHLDPDQVQAIAAYTQMEMLEAGYATNVEFHYLHHGPGGTPYANLSELSERIVAAGLETGIGLTLLPVLYQYGGCDRRELEGGQRRFGNDPDRFAQLFDGATTAMRQGPADWTTGAAPHSLRAVSPEGMTASVSLAPDGPLHMHLAEQLAEVEEVAAALGARPVEWVLDNLRPDGRWNFVHCTQMLPHETKGLARSGAQAVLCPITEASLGDGIFDGVNWLRHGGALAIGSDSNIRISLSEELRQLDHSQRLRDHSRAALATPGRSTGRRLLDAAATGGAMSAGRETGPLDVGQWADIVALDLTDPDMTGLTEDKILDTFIFARDDRLITDVWTAGRHMVSGGRHVHRDRITASYRQAIAGLRNNL